MDLHGASVNCERCGSEMHTNVGSRYSEWMSKARSDDEELHCSDCRQELSDPTERYIEIDATNNGDSVEFEVSLVNPTEASVGFSLKNPMFEEEDQWSDMTAWSEASEDQKGTVGVLAVVNESGDIVFEHEFKRFFSKDVPESQMIIGGERTKSMSVEWLENGEKKTRRDQTEHTRYVSDPNSAPYDHSELTAVFILEAVPRSNWEYKQASESVNL